MGTRLVAMGSGLVAMGTGLVAMGSGLVAMGADVIVSGAKSDGSIVAIPTSSSNPIFSNPLITSVREKGFFLFCSVLSSIPVWVQYVTKTWVALVTASLASLSYVRPLGSASFMT